jgi:hypothetical protein
MTRGIREISKELNFEGDMARVLKQGKVVRKEILVFDPQIVPSIASLLY